jgi:hypothetical protein
MFLKIVTIIFLLVFLLSLSCFGNATICQISNTQQLDPREQDEA